MSSSSSSSQGFVQGSHKENKDDKDRGFQIACGEEGKILMTVWQESETKVNDDHMDV